MRIQELFSGHSDAYGRYDIPASAAKNKRGKIKGNAITERTGYSEKLWDKHLAGEAGLGIIPIRNDSCCMWGCVDIDDYSMDVVAIVKLVKEIGLPLRVFRAKLGGCYVVAFFNTPVPAQDVRDCLIDVSAALGYAGSEVFPKQTVVSEFTMGNWLKMPYFAGVYGELTKQFAYDPNTFKGQTFLEFEASCEPIVPAELLEFSLKRWLEKQSKKSKTSEFDDGPPCLQALASAGKFPEGSRNVALFNIAIYRKKSADGSDKWTKKIIDDNNKYMTPAGHVEVSRIIRSISKKNYSYQCNEEPLASRCNKNLCKLRKYGITNKQASITGLQHLDTEPPTWIVQVDDQPLHLSSADKLKNQHLFSLAVMEQLQRAPLAYESKAWNAIVSRLFEDCQTVAMPEEASKAGHMLNLIVEFVTYYSEATDESQIHQGIPITSRGRTFFRSGDLRSFLRDHGEGEMQKKTNEFFALLRSMPEIEMEGTKRIAGLPVSLHSIKTPVRVKIKSPIEDDVPF